MTFSTKECVRNFTLAGPNCFIKPCKQKLKYATNARRAEPMPGAGALARGGTNAGGRADFAARITRVKFGKQLCVRILVYSCKCWENKSHVSTQVIQLSNHTCNQRKGTTNATSARQTNMQPMPCGRAGGRAEPMPGVREERTPAGRWNQLAGGSVTERVEFCTCYGSFSCDF